MEISKFLRMSFLIDGLVAIVYGLVMLLIPDIHANMFGFPYEEFADRFTGSLFLGYGVGNLLAYRASSWENVELVVLMNLITLVIGLLVILYSIAVALIPVAGYMQVGLVLFLMFLFLYSYYEVKFKKA